MRVQWHVSEYEEPSVFSKGHADTWSLPTKSYFLNIPVD